MKLFSLKGLLASLFIFSASGVYFASVFPASETIEVQADVLSRAGRSEPTGRVSLWWQNR